MPSPLQRQRILSASGAAYAPPLDGLASKVLTAWATFRLFTGNAESLRVRESGGSTEADIGTLASGGFDTTAFAAHVGAGSGYAAKGYDQNGAEDFLQATAGSQPQVVLTAMNSLPALTFASGNRLTTNDITNTIGTGDFEYWCLFKPTTLTGDRCLIAMSSVRPSLYCSTTSGAGKPAFWDGVAYRVFNTTLTSGSLYLVRLYRVSGVVYCAVNGTTEANSFAFTTSIVTPSKVALGSESVASSVSPYVGSMRAAMVFKSGLTSGEASALTTALKTIGGIA